MNRFEKPNEAPSGASCEEKKHRGGSPRIDACRALRVFLRPSRRWNRGGFESGSRRREGLRIKKLRPSGRGVITVPNDSEWLGGCALDPYLDPISDIARTARAFKNLLISYEWVIFNRSGAA